MSYLVRTHSHTHVACYDLSRQLRLRFGEDRVTEHRGQVLDFLAMTFDFTKSGEARVTMKRLVDDILEGCGVDKTYATPACCKSIV